ncbi:hypothetical protein [Pseudozobellia sp. WGM2]|uniref:hypothetical protein n=1 Tax=Pseudozobellia sp. WGM2 TaxID=2787625 RepID=UPI00352FD69E
MGLEFVYKNGHTPLDEEEKDGLKIKSITTQGELDEFQQLNIEKAVEWTIHTNLKPENILTEKFAKDLHKKCMVMYGNGLVNLEELKKISEFHLQKLGLN